MSSKESKFNGSASHRRAILHMIGQVVDMFKKEPTTSEVASWMNVSKPTARKHLKEMREQGELWMSSEYHRPNVCKHTWRLTSMLEYHYDEGLLKADYQCYAQKVMKVILT